MLSQAHKTPVHYTWWPGSSAVDGSAPDYILWFEGFDKVYPGVEYFDHYPALKEDVDKGRIPFQVLSHLEGPAGTGIWIYAKKRLVSHGGPRASDVILEAESFQRGVVKIDKEQYGRNIGVILTPQAPAYAEYDFKAPVTGEYQIEFRYASAAPRPVMLLIDGAVVNRAATGSVTGGFYPENQRWEPAELVKLTQGEHTLRIQSESVFPHIDRILLSPSLPVLFQK